DLRADARRPLERHAPHGDAVVPARNPRRRARRRGGTGDRDGAFSPGGGPVLLLRPAAARLAAGRDRQVSETAHDSTGMAYLDTPARRWVTVYLPLGVFLFVLLFPFYWMAMTSLKPDAELISRDANPF